MKRKVKFIMMLFCVGCLAAEPAAGIKAAGIQVAAEQTALSADNSLEVLSLSAGTLSPDFTGKTVQYTATVPNDVTSVTVTATPVNEYATVQSISGNEDLKVGVNTIKVVVKAQNGALAQYTITLTREEAQSADAAASQTTDAAEQPADGNQDQTTDAMAGAVAGAIAEQPADAETDQETDTVTDETADASTDGTNDQTAETGQDVDTSNMEYLQQQYNDLSDQYAKEKSLSRNVMGIMAFVIAVLVVIIINLLLRGRKNDDWDDEDDDWEWKRAENKTDITAADDFPDEDFTEETKKEDRAREAGTKEEESWADEVDETEKNEPAGKGFFHRRTVERKEVAEESEEIKPTKLHKVRAGLFGMDMSDDLEDEDWDEDEEFVRMKNPEEKQKPEERQRPERKQKLEESQKPERKQKPEERQRPEKKQNPEEKQRPEKKQKSEEKIRPEKYHPEENEDDDLEVIDLNDL